MCPRREDLNIYSVPMMGPPVLTTIALAKALIMSFGPYIINPLMCSLRMTLTPFHPSQAYLKTNIILPHSTLKPFDDTYRLNFKLCGNIHGLP